MDQVKKMTYTPIELKLPNINAADSSEVGQRLVDALWNRFPKMSFTYCVSYSYDPVKHVYSLVTRLEVGSKPELVPDELAALPDQTILESFVEGYTQGLLFGFQVGERRAEASMRRMFRPW